MPAGDISGRSRASCAAKTARSVTNRCARSSPATGAARSAGGSSPSVSAATAAGIANRQVSCLGAIPSFLLSGVPE